MSKRALWNVPHVRLSLIPMALAVSLAAAGCGGGGGGGTPSPTPTGTNRSSPTLATVTGTVTVVGSSSTPIPGAVVEIAGTNLSKTTDSNGQFVIYNVPVGTVGITVLRPAGGQYTTIASYGPSGSALQYNDTAACPIPLVTTASGTSQTPTTLPYSIQLYSSASPPAPPVTSGANGCPK